MCICSGTLAARINLSQTTYDLLKSGCVHWRSVMIVMVKSGAHHAVSRIADSIKLLLMQHSGTANLCLHNTIVCKLRSSARAGHGLPVVDEFRLQGSRGALATILMPVTEVLTLAEDGCQVSIVLLLAVVTQDIWVSSTADLIREVHLLVIILTKASSIWSHYVVHMIL